MKKILSCLLMCLLMTSCMCPASFEQQQVELLRFRDGTVNAPGGSWISGYNPSVHGMPCGLDTNPATVRVGMSSDELRTALGEPSHITTNRGLLRWSYPTGDRRWITLLIISLPLAGNERWEFVIQSNQVQRILFLSTDTAT